MKVAIIGCGYAGRVLARRLIERGDPVRATTTSEARLGSLALLGAEPLVVRADRIENLGRALKDAEAVVYLAPPVPNQSADQLAADLAKACRPDLRAFVYGSTTSVFGRPVDPSEWVDETTPPRALSERARERLDIERSLARVGLPLKVVRIAGIYGPGRTMREALRKQQLVLFEGGPPTSRIHVDDLARILEAMLEPHAPPLALACDEEPKETLEVARYTCALLGIEPPEPVAVEDARRVLSPLALEMRLGGHRCRSLVRKRLIGPLLYPTYKEGIRASLEAEGALAPAV